MNQVAYIPEPAGGHRQGCRRDAVKPGKESHEAVLACGTSGAADRYQQAKQSVAVLNAEAKTEPGDLGAGSHISVAEVAEVVRKLLGGKAPGVDESRPDALRLWML